MKMIRNLKLGVKIGLGFTIILILTIIVAFLGWLALGGVSDRVDKADDMNRLVKFILSTKGERLEFLYTKNEANATELRTILANVLKQAKETRDLKFKDKLNKDQMNAVIAATNKYKDAFEKLVKASEQAEKVDKDMVVLGQKMATIADSTNNHQIENLIIRLRLEEKNYIFYKDPKFIPIVEKVINRLENATRSMPRLYSMTLKYKKDFKILVKDFESLKKYRAILVKVAVDARKIVENARIDQKSKMQSQVDSAEIIMFVTALIALLLGILVAFFITKNITTPVKIFMQKFELGAGGDLNVEVQKMSNDEIGLLGDYFNRFMRALKNIVEQTLTNMDQVQLATEEVSQGNQDLSSRVDSQSASLEETASSIEEMTANLKNMAENANLSLDLAKSTQVKANEGREIIESTVQAIQKTAVQAEQIKEIVKIINGIAFQTNILALNAAVEAARAKDHGKGFAVVANEVRNLAQKSAENATQIEGMIEQIVKGIRTGNEMAMQSQEKFKEIQEQIEKSGSMIQEVSASADEQANGVEQVNTATAHLDEITQANASLVEEVAASSEELASQAEAVLELLQFFKVERHKNNSSSKVKSTNTSKQTPTPPTKKTAPKKFQNKFSKKRTVKKEEKSNTSERSNNSNTEKQSSNSTPKNTPGEGFIEF